MGRREVEKARACCGTDTTRYVQPKNRSWPTTKNATRQSRNRSQTGLKRRDAEGAEERGGEELLLSPFSAFLSESQRLCVNSSPPASESGFSSAEKRASGGAKTNHLSVTGLQVTGIGLTLR